MINNELTQINSHQPSHVSASRYLHHELVVLVSEPTVNLSPFGSSYAQGFLSASLDVLFQSPSLYATSEFQLYKVLSKIFH